MEKDCIAGRRTDEEDDEPHNMFAAAPLSVSLGQPPSTNGLFTSSKIRRGSDSAHSREGSLVLREEVGGTTRSEGPDVVEKFTIALMGGGATGKSSLIVRMLHDTFDGDNGDNDPTLLDEYELPYHFENRSYSLTLLDTAGQEQFSEQRMDAVKGAKGFLLVYDVTQRLSFEEVEVFMNDLCRARLKDTKDMPIVIVGNKGDVPDELRQVSKAEASKFAEDNGCPLIETSARSGKNVHKVLEKVLQEITYYHTKALRGIMYKMKGAYTTPSIRIKGKIKWTKCHFSMDRENFSWFASKNKHKPRGFIPLSTVVGVREAEKETQRPNSLLIKSLLTYFFYADTEEARDMWIHEIRIHASKAQSDREIGSGDEIVRTLDGVLVEEEINFNHDTLRDIGHELLQVRAIRTYKSKVGSELSFNKGNVITVVKVEEERYKGVLGRRKGWFPRSHVQDIKEGSGDGDGGSGSGITIRTAAEQRAVIRARMGELENEQADGSPSPSSSGSGSGSGSLAAVAVSESLAPSSPVQATRRGSGIRGRLGSRDETAASGSKGIDQERPRNKGSRLMDKLLGSSGGLLSREEKTSKTTSEKDKAKEDKDKTKEAKD